MFLIQAGTSATGDDEEEKYQKRVSGEKPSTLQCNRREYLLLYAARDSLRAVRTSAGARPYVATIVRQPAAEAVAFWKALFSYFDHVPRRLVTGTAANGEA